MKRSLLDIGDDLRALDELMEECEGEIVDEALEKWFSEIGAERDDKIDRYCFLIDDLTASAKRHKEDAATYAKWAATDENKAKRLKERLRDFFEAHGIAKLETAHYKPRVQNNGGVQPLDIDGGINPLDLPEDFQIVQANADAIREYLQSGEELEYARLLPRGTHLRIR